MKKKIIAFDKNCNQTEKEILYIPVRYILAVLITIAETAAVVRAYAYSLFQHRCFAYAAWSNAANHALNLYMDFKRLCGLHGRFLLQTAFLHFIDILQIIRMR